jgi:hypothetical protein
MGLILAAQVFNIQHIIRIFTLVIAFYRPSVTPLQRAFLLHHLNELEKF